MVCDSSHYTLTILHLADLDRSCGTHIMTPDKFHAYMVRRSSSVSHKTNLYSTVLYITVYNRRLIRGRYQCGSQCVVPVNKKLSYGTPFPILGRKVCTEAYALKA